MTVWVLNYRKTPAPLTNYGQFQANIQGNFQHGHAQSYIFEGCFTTASAAQRHAEKEFGRIDWDLGKVIYGLERPTPVVPQTMPLNGSSRLGYEFTVEPMEVKE